MQVALLSTVALFGFLALTTTDAFAPTSLAITSTSSSCALHRLKLYAKKNARSTGGGGFGSSSSSATPPKGKKSRGDLISALNDDDDSKMEEKKFSRTFVKTDQEQLLNDLAAKSSRTIIGQAVSKSPDYGSPDMDPFWSLLPSLISTKFPNANDTQLKRVAGMVEFSLGLRDNVLEDDVISNPWRPHDELHAYMPGLGSTEPFLDPDQLDLCRQLSEHYDVIRKEYEALYENRFDRKGNDRFQSVTSMNCEIVCFVLNLCFVY